ncbi:hypothetical protein PhCBS80983_g05381 [Powellomyces hirtus]|uniref:Nitrate reductase [NADPH] n=1 Tax=Powellomyces hirtus TaxID=109895 RepID=A0A507DVZ4_9FUNG|nr:hypothetical protein PhCBS80983_g05381 [Powellomyces hirtus]
MASSAFARCLPRHCRRPHRVHLFNSIQHTHAFPRPRLLTTSKPVNSTVPPLPPPHASNSSSTNGLRLPLLAAALAALAAGGALWIAPRSLYTESLALTRHGEKGGKKDDMLSLFSKHSNKGREEHEINSVPAQRPRFKRSEISTHTSKAAGGIWIIHNNGVYDITDFVDVHPGGERILLAAGRSIDPFWSVFTIHQTPETKELLEQYRIGDVEPPRDAIEAAENAAAEERDRDALKDLFKFDPKRDPELITHAAYPCNAEAPARALVDAPITPTEKFFVRNHLPVPDIDTTTYRLAVQGPGIPDGVALSLEDLKKLPKKTVTVTLQCAGNRRKDMHDVKPTKGLQWSQGAISTATWGGVLLRDVLKQAGYNTPPSTTTTLPDDDQAISHVQFHGTEGYGASIPFHKAISAQGDVLLAYEMNGEPLPADHGAPIRVVVPGYVAARSVKWVDRITLSDEESWSHWQRKDYKGFSPSTEMPCEEDYENAKSIQELPVQSAVLLPAKGQNVTLTEQGEMVCKGYAVSGGGREVVRVDVSADGGRTWTTATLKPAATDARPGRQWAWSHWDAKIPVSSTIKGKEVEIVCKAVDDSYNSQPEKMEGIWNMRGVLSTAWHRVTVKVAGAEGEGKEVEGR